jgi:16S rRNA (adenine1518-N6/adenine1519-N6)-dimethyltransferase
MIFAKKSLGQNFLKSEKALNQIVEAGDVKPSDLILEIGPGEGALTKKILEKKATLVVVEKDDRLIPLLEELSKTTPFNIIHKDIIEIFDDSIPVIEQLKNISNTSQKTYKVIANIPYYITGQIIRKIFEQPVLPEKVVLLVQKEVADRIVTNKDNKESLLSLSVKLFGKPRRVAVVPKGAFAPSPTVDSAIICIEDIQRLIPREKEYAFFELLKAGFAHKRKRLLKNLHDHYKTILWEDIFNNLEIDKNIRAEDIHLDTYIKIFNNI